jgi:DNA-binding MarR family transcriptional regulator
MLRQSFTYQLASIAEEAVGPAARLFRTRFGLDVHELRVLRLVDDQPGVTFTSLARQTRFERSATSRILSRLIKAGLVRRKIDDNDARQFLLRVTPKGRALRERADPLSLELEALILSTLTASERQDFRRILDKLSQWLSSDFPGELEARYPEAGPVHGKQA